MKLIINAVSAVEGGALSVVKAYLENLDEEAICFVTVQPNKLPHKRVAKNAIEIATMKHTWDYRVGNLFDILGLAKQKYKNG